MMETLAPCCRGKVAAAPATGAGILPEAAGSAFHMLALKDQTAMPGHRPLSEIMG